MESIYRAMGKRDKLRLICFALILFVFPVAGSIQSSQPGNARNTRPGDALPSLKSQPYTVKQDSPQALWAQGARRVCL